jgi:hypothetical protein
MFTCDWGCEWFSLWGGDVSKMVKGLPRSVAEFLRTYRNACHALCQAPGIQSEWDSSFWRTSGPYSRTPRVLRSPGTALSALGSHLFSIWNVLFWFWVKPQEKGFYFWNAYFQLYIPLDGIRFSWAGVCANRVLSHVSSLAVETCCFVERGWWFYLSTALVRPHVQCALGMEKKECLQRKQGPGSWTLWFLAQGRDKW